MDECPPWDWKVIPNILKMGPSASLQDTKHWVVGFRGLNHQMVPACVCVCRSALPHGMSQSLYSNTPVRTPRKIDVHHNPLTQELLFQCWCSCKYCNPSIIYSINVIPAGSEVEKSNLALICNPSQYWTASTINENQLMLWRFAALFVTMSYQNQT